MTIENPESATFKNPLPEDQRKKISHHAGGYIGIRINEDREAMNHLQRSSREIMGRNKRMAKIAHLVLALIRPEYDNPQEYLAALNAYDVAWKHGRNNSVRNSMTIDLLGSNYAHLQTGREQAETLVEGYGLRDPGPVVKRLIRDPGNAPDEMDRHGR